MKRQDKDKRRKKKEERTLGEAQNNMRIALKHF